MRVAVVNFSGNTGKSTLAAHLFVPRIEEAPLFHGRVDQRRRRWASRGALRALHDHWLTIDEAIVDVGASSVEDTSHLPAPLSAARTRTSTAFVVPTVTDQKQQDDTVRTIEALGEMGVAPDRIRVVFNRIDPRDLNIFESDFQTILSVGGRKKTLPPQS